MAEHIDREKVLHVMKIDVRPPFAVVRDFPAAKVRDSPGQAERTAWRNVRDWIIAQMAIIEAGQVEMEEVFLPYLTDRQGRTLYELYQSGQLALGDGSEVRHE